MASITCYPQTIEQITDTTYQDWKDVANLKSGNNNYASTKILTKDELDKPNILKLTNFGFNIPVGAEVTSIVVKYSQRKTAKNSGKYPSIAAPTITLLGANLPKTIVSGNISLPHDINSVTGSAPTSSFKEKSKTWNGKVSTSVLTATYGNKQTISGSYTLPSRDRINSSSFGVKINWPRNTSKNSGYLELKYVSITIKYKEPAYSLQLEKVGNTSIQDGVVSSFRVTLNNVNLVNYKNTVRITLPQGTTVESYDMDSEGVSRNGNIVTWSPTQSKNIGSKTLQLNCIFPLGNQNITAIETYSNVSVSRNFSVDAISTGLNYIDTDASEIIYTKQNEEFNIEIRFPENSIISDFYLNYDRTVYIKDGNSWIDSNFHMISGSQFVNGILTLTCKVPNIGVTNLRCNFASGGTLLYRIKALPSNATTPTFSIFKLEAEEINRMGDGHTYILDTFLKINCEQSDINSFVDYYRTFRMGVVNHIPETDDKFEIFEACTNFSSVMTTFNNYEEKTVEFVYDEHYPVYILMIGDYTIQDLFHLEFSQPILSDSESYNGYDNSTYFPTPILNLVTEGEYSAEMNLPGYVKGNKLIFYNLGFEDDFGTDDLRAIRGLQINLDIDVESPLILHAKLKSNKGTGERSIIVNPGENKIAIGDEFDLWGFSIFDMLDLNAWEIELECSNVLNDSSNNLSIEKITVTAYFLTLKRNLVNMFVEGENMRHYGLFIKNVTLSPGLKTKTKYGEVEGSDIHNPASMNIDKKEIEVEFNVRGCTLDETTALLREIAKKMVNERDELNRPIAKRVEFSHVPDFHFDYILEDTIDEDPKVVGYDSKMKLIVYDGTSWANSDTITNVAGANKGIAKVSPVIQLIPLSSDVEITEEVHNQKFTMENDSFSTDCVIEIRCADKQVYMITGDSDPIEITDCVDWDVDWFVLYPGEFRFEDNGTCIIQNIIHTQRGA